MNIYLVVGSTGEYVDACQWNACCFLDKKKAEVFCDGLNMRLKELGVHYSSENPGLISLEKSTNVYEVMIKFDKKFVLDYTGSEYEVKEVEIRGE